MPGPFIVRNSDTTLEDDAKDSYFVSNSQLYKTRIVILALIIAHITWRIVRASSSYFYYLTNWNWLINFVYFSVTVFLTTRQSSPYLNNGVFKYFYSSTACLSWIVTIVYWTLLSGELFDDIPVEQKIGGTLSHTLNIIYPMIDLTLNKAAVSLIWVFAPITLSSAYMIMVVLFRSLRGDPWPYPFLLKVNNQDTGVNWLNSAIFFVGFCLICFAFHVFSMVLAKWRTKIGLKRQRKVKNQEIAPMSQV